MFAVIRKYALEWLKTLSDQPSFFSSKRLERGILITTALVLICCYVWHKRNELGAFEFMTIVTPLFAYAGFNTIQVRKEKQDDKDTPPANQ